MSVVREIIPCIIFLSCYIFHNSLWNHFVIKWNQLEWIFPNWSLAIDLFFLFVEKYFCRESSQFFSFLLYYFIPYLPPSYLAPQSTTWWTLWKGQTLAGLNTLWAINCSYSSVSWSSQVFRGLASWRVPKEFPQPLRQTQPSYHVT